MIITDINGEALGYLPADLRPGEETAPVTVIIAAAAGRRLRASIAAEVQILARQTGTPGDWADISAAPVDLTPFAGQSVQWDIKVAALAGLTGRLRLAGFVGVTYSKPAGITL